MCPDIISTGPCAAVRHPMHAYALIFCLSPHLLLGSLWEPLHKLRITRGCGWLILSTIIFVMENRMRYLLLFGPLAIGRMCVGDDSGGHDFIAGHLTSALTTVARATSAALRVAIAATDPLTKAR